MSSSRFRCVCQACGMRFYQWTELRKHFDEKPGTCNVVGENFNKLYDSKLKGFNVVTEALNCSQKRLGNFRDFSTCADKEISGIKASVFVE